MSSSKNTLYLVDISSFIFRAFFAIRALTTKSGEPVNAVYGVATMLARLAEEAHPEHLAVTYDSKGPSFREKIYPEYKANRDEPPEDLIPQFKRIEELIQCLEMPSFRKDGVEADDLIATLSRRWCEEDKSHRVVIVSSDKDLMQLVNERVCVWDTMNSKYFHEEQVIEKFGVKPTQIRDYLGLVGDSSDNIPGVPGVGPKTAAELLKAHGDLDGVLAAAKAGKIPGKKGETLKAHEADARISARLATVDDRVDVPFDHSLLAYRFHVTPGCLDLLRSMDFNSLVTKWSGETRSSATSPAPTTAPSSAPPRIEGSLQADPGHTFRCVNSEKDFIQMLESADQARNFGFDLETTSLNPREAEIVGVAICHDPLFGCYIPIGHRGTDVAQLPAGYVLEKLKPFLESAKFGKIGQNLKFDWSVLNCLGLKPEGILADTMIASYVLDPDARHNLETLAAKYLGYTVTTYEQVCGKGKDQIGFDQVPVDQATRYSAEDAWIAFKLWEKMKPLIEERGLLDIFSRVDLPLVPVLSRMECAGICLDEGWLKKLSVEFEREQAKIEERVRAFASGEINLNSPKQMAQLLFEELKLPPQAKTKTGYSTDVTVLEALEPLHEVPRLLLEYREIAKLRGTYIDPLPLLKDPKTGKIHASFHQAVAATGRLSSSDPNLQNIPVRSKRGLKIRGAFIPSPGNVLLSADYNQIELRILAHMSGDPELSRSFRENEDVHARTASEIFGVPAASVDERQRGIAKAINFGLMYGKTVFGLAQELKIPRGEAKEIIERYFARYSGVKRFLDDLVIQAKEKGYATTLLGRQRALPDLASRNPALRNNAERMAMNTPIQGTAADLMKLAMIEIDRRIRAEGLRSKILIQVHDEVVLDCPKDEVERARALVTDAMENAMKLDVPLKVNSGTGGNWMEL